MGSNASPTVKPEALAAGRRPEVLWNGRLTWILNDRTLLEAQHGGHNTRFIGGPRDPSGIDGPPGHYDLVTGIRSVNMTSYTDSLTRPVNASIAVTRYATPSSGRGHQMKAGFEYEFARLRSQNGYPGGMVFNDRNGQADTVTIQAPWTYRPDHERETFYVQDAWTATDRLTVNGGVRVGLYRGAITGFPTQFSAHSIAPRIGLAWDVLPAHTLAVRAHYGRYHEAMVTTFYDHLDPLSQPTSITAQVIGPNEFREISRFVTTNAYSIDPSIRYPYADEWVAGIERSLPGHGSLTARHWSPLRLDPGVRWIDELDPGPGTGFRVRMAGSARTTMAAP